MSVTHTLVHLGNLATFDIKDDGPFTGSDGDVGSPSQGRQMLLSSLAKKDADGKPVFACVTDTLERIAVQAGAMGTVPLLQVNPAAKAPTDVIAKVKAANAAATPAPTAADKPNTGETFAPIVAAPAPP